MIVGPSGTGKSVLLKHLIALLRPDAGEGLRRRPELLGARRRRPQRAAQEVRHVLPGRRPLRFDERLRQHRFSIASHRPPEPGRRSGAGRRVPRARAAARHRLEAAVRALGRHAAPRRLRPGHRAQAGDPALRRAQHGTRPDHDRYHRGGDPRDPPPDGADDRDDHASHAERAGRSATAWRCSSGAGSCSRRRRRSSCIRAIRRCGSSSKGGPRARCPSSRREPGAKPFRRRDEPGSESRSVLSGRHSSSRGS